MTASQIPVAAAFDPPDYTDRFELALSEPLDTIELFVERLTRRQPRWLTALSMGIADADELADQTDNALRGIDAQNADALSRGAVGIGNWRIVERGDDHITFFEDMKIMRYRLTYRRDSPRSVSAETEVVQQSRFAGPLYWGLAQWGHRRFLPLMLRNAGGPGSVVTAVR